MGALAGACVMAHARIEHIDKEVEENPDNNALAPGLKESRTVYAFDASRLKNTG
jgi:hypothetical protein